jgi:hypothetical protein
MARLQMSVLSTMLLLWCAKIRPLAPAWATRDAAPANSCPAGVEDAEHRTTAPVTLADDSARSSQLPGTVRLESFRVQFQKDTQRNRRICQLGSILRYLPAEISVWKLSEFTVKL